MKITPLVVICMVMVMAVGCKSKKVEVVDLDKVLAIFDETANQEHQTDADPDAEPVTTEDGEQLEEDNPKAVQEFLTAFQTNLNAAKLIPSTITVAIDAEGKIIGFKDADADFVRDANETEYFSIAIDAANNRLVASQTVPGGTYHRDHSYSGRHYHGGGGFFWGYMVGSMFNRQNAYYSRTGNPRPNYGAMQMSQRGYHSNAASRARSVSRASRSSARSRGGSGGFRGGK